MSVFIRFFVLDILRYDVINFVIFVGWDEEEVEGGKEEEEV